MRRSMTACAGWLAFAGVLWMWSASGGVRPGADVQGAAEGRAEAAGARVAPGAGAPGRNDERVFVIAPPSVEGGPVKARLRVTLETLGDAAAQNTLRPGEDVAVAIQRAASRAGRRTWFPADWTADGKLDTADIAAYAAAYRDRLPSADLNHDGVVDERDFAEFMRLFRLAESRLVEATSG